VSEYAVPAVAPGREEVLIANDGTVFGGVMVSDAVPDLLVSAALVAVTVAFSLLVTLGDVYSPLELIVPTVADHVTATLEVPVTVAVNCTVFCDAIVVVTGVTDTLTVSAPVTVI